MYRRKLDLALNDAEEAIGNIATWPGAETAMNDLLSNDDAKKALGADLDAAAKKFATFKKLNSKKAAAYWTEQAQNQMKETDEKWTAVKATFANADESQSSKDSAAEEMSRQMQSMRESIAKLPADKRILLVGHSAGAIFIGELLKAADERGIDRKFEVVFLAPAVRMDRFASTLDNNFARVAAFRMFTMTDDNERKDVLVPQVAFFYPCSLLYFISGVLESIIDCPLVGMDRFYRGPIRTDEVGVEGVRAFFAKDINLAAWSVSSTEPQRMTNALDHGDYGHPAFKVGANSVRNTTFDSIASIVKNGFQ